MSRRSGRLAAAIAVAGCLLSSAPLPMQASGGDVVYGGPTTNRTIALTFDDGYSPSRCLEIADILQRARVPATWFPNGRYVRASPEVWRTIASRYPIANHTMTHASLVDLSPKGIRHELLADQRTIERATGRPMLRMLRPSYGAYDGRVLRIARRLGYQVVMWTLSAADTSPHGTDRGIAMRALKGGPGSIILMHCGPEVTPRILPIVIARYACAGFRFATVDELLAGSRGAAARVSCPPPDLPAAPSHHHRPPAQPELPDVLSYDLGDATGPPSGLPADTRLRGVMSVPQGDGPFPVAVLIHAAPDCGAAPVAEPSAPGSSALSTSGPGPSACPVQADAAYQELGDLASRLAARGYLAIVPDLASVFATPDGSLPPADAAAPIIDAQLDALVTGLGYPPNVADRADPGHLVVVGLGEGAGLAVGYATDPVAAHRTSALGLLAPDDAAAASVPGTMPLAILLPGCETEAAPADTGTMEPSAARPGATDAAANGTAPAEPGESPGPSESARPAALVVHTLNGGTVAAFTTVAGEGGSTCASGKPMSPLKQRRISAGVLGDLFDAALTEARS